MAKVTSALATYDVTTNREDLSDVVYRISPVDTPFMTAVPRNKASAVLHEWSLDTIESTNSTNARLEGDALTRATSSSPSRLTNYCQISSRDVTVSGTQRATNPAGIDDMLAFQKAKKSLALKKDMEYICLGNTGQVAGNTTTARKLRSLNAWISGNGSRGTNGADSTGATYASTDGTAGDLRAFTETLLKDAILDAYTDGGEPSIVLVSPTNKQLASAFSGRTTQQQMVAEEKILGAASIYASDFGDLKIVPSRTQRGRDVWVLDTTKVAISYLRPFETQEQGRVGDAVTQDIIAEYTLEVRAADAHSLIADTTG